MGPLAVRKSVLAVFVDGRVSKAALLDDFDVAARRAGVVLPGSVAAGGAAKGG
jgi:hypothetical protein